MGKYIDGSGLSHFMGIIKGAFAAKADAIKNITRSGTTFTATRADGTSFTFTQQDNTVAKTTTTPKMNGTAAIGTETKYAAGDHVHPSDTSRVPTSRTVCGHALSSDVTLTYSDVGLDVFEGATLSADGDIGLVPAPVSSPYLQVLQGGGSWTPLSLGFTTGTDFPNKLKVDIVAGTGDSAEFPVVTTDNAGLMTTTLFDKLDGIAAGAQVNQNAFSNVKVGSTTVAADSKTDTLELVAGSNVTLTPDATNDKVTIASSYTDTKNTAGSTDSSSKLFIIGATSQAANPQTYSQDTAYVGTDGHLYSNSVQVVNLSGSQALTNKTYNGYTLAAACAKGVDTSISAGSTSTNVPTTAAVVNYMTTVAGALVYQGTLGTGGTVTQLPANHRKGWYYVVKTAGTYTGIVCEAGDMIICNTTGTTANTEHWDAVQSNIEVLSNSEIDTLWAAA